MLIVKVYINKKKIDELHVQNVGKLSDKFYYYNIIKPEHPDTVIHNRGNGYVPLLKKVCEQLERIGHAVYNRKTGK